MAEEKPPELTPSDPESRLTDWAIDSADIEWIEQEPTRLKKINIFKKPRHKWKGLLEELRTQIEELSTRLDTIEQSIPGLEHGVVTWNTRWGHVVFSPADLASVDGATQTWVLDQLPSITITEIDGGIF